MNWLCGAGSQTKSLPLWETFGRSLRFAYRLAPTKNEASHPTAISEFDLNEVTIECAADS
jgi:hypothetical protein